jgi:DNA polymerase V
MRVLKATRGNEIRAIVSFKVSTIQRCPLFSSMPSAGFPSPADDYIEQSLDLNEFLIRHPAATFFVRVSGDSMIGAGIHDGDILIVDRALDAREGNVIIAVLSGEFTVKRFKKANGKAYLVPDNPKYTIIDVTMREDFEIWGVVTNVIHSVR